MDLPDHPSVDQLTAAIDANGGTIACNVCSRQDFSIEQIAPMMVGGGQGERRRQRTDLTCENCGHVMGFDLDKLRASRP